jgi:ParB family chromosome partitioning protein
MKDLKIEQIRVEQLIERVGENPNVMEPEQFALLIAAIKRVGFLQPVLVRDPKDLPPNEEAIARLGGRPYWEIIDGVHRVRAAHAAGLESVPAVVVDSDEAEAAALQIGMNRMRGELNLGVVARTLDALQSEGWDREELALTGFSTKEIDDLLKAIAPPEDPLTGGAAGTVDPRESAEPKEESEERFVLEIPFASKKALTSAKKVLRRAGDGDLTKGLLHLIESS